MIDFLKINTKSHLKRNKSTRVCLPYKQALHAGIIFTVEDKQKHQQIKEFLKRLEGDGKKTSVVCYLPQDKQNYEFLFDYFSTKDFTFFGNVTSPAALKFIDYPFDYLFYLDTEPNPLILNLLARSKARCRMGKYWEDGKPYFEFMLESLGGVKGLMDELYKYTSLLR